LQDSNLLDAADLAIARLKHLDLSKYNIHDPALPPPDPGYVLVVDQTRRRRLDPPCRGVDATFRAMLEAACSENPDSHIVIRSHPETSAGLRPGHYGPAEAGAG
jgi:capsular polysaccharide export protein